jgi:hypothetical protein
VRLALLVPITLLASACGASHRTPVPGTAKLFVQQTIDRSGPTPIEGAYSYVRIEDTGGGTVTVLRLPADGKASIPLSPGSYTLVSYQRTCDANCGNLDPASESCSGRFDAAERPSLSASITVTYGSGCKILFASSMPSG